MAVLEESARHRLHRTRSKSSFGTVFAYTNGTIVYRREVFDQVRPTSRGFFIHAECLIKAIRAGFTFVEVPVKL